MFKVSNKAPACSGASIVNFEHVNADWDCSI